jgi:hypothetical protein
MSMFAQAPPGYSQAPMAAPVEQYVAAIPTFLVATADLGRSTFFLRPLPFTIKSDDYESS